MQPPKAIIKLLLTMKSPQSHWNMKTRLRARLGGFLAWLKWQGLQNGPQSDSGYHDYQTQTTPTIYMIKMVKIHDLCSFQNVCIGVICYRSAEGIDSLPRLAQKVIDCLQTLEASLPNNNLSYQWTKPRNNLTSKPNF